MHPSSRVYVLRHVSFNPEEFPFPHLFSQIHTSQSVSSIGLPTIVLNSFPFSVKSSHSPQVAPTDSLVSSATSLSSTVPKQSTSIPIESTPSSFPTSNSTSV